MKVTETTKVLLIKVNNNNTGLAYNHIQKILDALLKAMFFRYQLILSALSSD